MTARDASVTTPHQAGGACFHLAGSSFYHCPNQDVGGILTITDGEGKPGREQLVQWVGRQKQDLGTLE